MPPANLPPTIFLERQSGASRMQESLLAAGPYPAVGAYSAPQSPSFWGGGSLALPEEPTPLSALWASGFGPSGLAPDPK